MAGKGAFPLISIWSKRYALYKKHIWAEADQSQWYIWTLWFFGPLEKIASDTGFGFDSYLSLVMGEAKTSTEVGFGVEDMPLPGANLNGAETGSTIELIFARLQASVDIGTSVEVGGLLKDLFATEVGQGIDTLLVKSEIFSRGEGTKFFAGGDRPPHRAS